MPQPDGQELGIRSPFSNRVGIDVDRFRGMNRQSDPGSIGNDQFWLLQNARIDGTGIKNRPGLTSVFGNALDGCVYGIFDDLNPNDGNAIFWGTGSNLNGFSPEFWAAVNATTPDPSGSRVHGTLNGVHYLIDDTGNGTSIAYTTASQAPTFVYGDYGFASASVITGPAVRSAVEWNGGLWYVLSSGDSNDAEIWSYLGGSDSVLDTTLGGFTDIRSILATDGSDLYIASQNAIRQRNGGAWTALTFPGGLTSWTCAGWYGLCRPPSVFFSGVDSSVAAASQVMTVLEVNNGTVSIANQSVPTYTGTQNLYSDIAEFRGNFYMIGVTTQGVNNISLYKIDGANAATTVLDLTAEIGATGPASLCWVPLVFWRGQLYTILNTTGGVKMLRSAYGDPSATGWTVVGAAALVSSAGDGQPVFSA